MKYYTAITILIFTLSFSALSNSIFGRWQGEGTLTYPDGTSFEFMETTINLKKRGKKLFFSHDYLLCANLEFVIVAWFVVVDRQSRVAIRLHLI